MTVCCWVERDLNLACLIEGLSTVMIGCKAVLCTLGLGLASGREDRDLDLVLSIDPLCVSGKAIFKLSCFSKVRDTGTGIGLIVGESKGDREYFLDCTAGGKGGETKGVSRSGLCCCVLVSAREEDNEADRL